MDAREHTLCLSCGVSSAAPLCSITCRAAAREEFERNAERIERLRSLGFDACLDEVQAVVRRNGQLTAALDDPTLLVEARTG